MLHGIDWAVIAVYIAFVLCVGVFFARRAGRNLDEYFLSGRKLPWWIAGTSMVATSFAADTPLLISGWVREAGIARNWVWWCYAISGTLQIYLFARWWRRGGVMTKAELAELRYQGRGSRFLRGLLGVMHAGVVNTLVIAWVLLAGGKIAEVLFEVDRMTGITLACLIALSYSLLAGFWGVVVTDLVQFLMAMGGAIALAVICWNAAGGGEALLAAAADSTIRADTLRFLPAPGPGGWLDSSFWTAPVAAFTVYIAVQWWAVENVDGSGTIVQRICASRDERQGMLATLWFNVSHYALRPWCWIAVGLASLLTLPRIEVHAPVDGVVTEVTAERIVIAAAGSEPVTLALAEPDGASDWRPLPAVEPQQPVRRGALVAHTDAERAYVVMMRRYLPIGLLGLVAASLLAAFMSTIDTHVNLASSFFVNDVYRRFLKPEAGTGEYVLVARLTSAAVLALGALIASLSESVRALFEFFLAFGAGAGIVYVGRWFWWRIRASTEITAMLASAVSTIVVTHADLPWRLGPLSPGGDLSRPGRLIVVVVFSLACACLSLLLTRAPDPAGLVPFYRKVRPLGCWGPVRALCTDVRPRISLGAALLGAAGSLAMTFGLMMGIGFVLLDRTGAASMAGLACLLGTVLTIWTFRRLREESSGSQETPEEER